MPAIELEEVQMVEVSDEFLESVWCTPPSANGMTC